MITTESAIIISTLFASLSVCLVKVISTIQQSKCVEIEMCCIKCKRELKPLDEHSDEHSDEHRDEHSDEHRDAPIPFEDVEKELPEI